MISRRRHAVKAVTWRVVATTATVVIVGVGTGDWRLGLGVGGVEIPTKMLLYYLHERFWYKFVGLGVGGGQAE